jgi:GT2 family glycosyltransferase
MSLNGHSDQVSIVAVVVTHNRPDDLRKVVLALQKQSHPLDCILILDNVSEVPAMTTLSDFSDIEVVRSPVNTGGAGGFALGMEAALERAADWIWLMDDDAVPRSNALHELVDAQSKIPGRIGALCSSVYEDDKLALVHRRNYTRLWGMEFSIPNSCYSKAFAEIDTGSFVGFFVRGEAVRQIGLPDRDFFLAYDDTEYSLRLIRNGWRNWLVPSSKIDHLRTTQSRLRTSLFGPKHYFNIRNRIVVALRYGKSPMLAGAVATFFGIGLWLVCGGFRAKGGPLFTRAVRDGWRGRLGPLE